MSDWRTTEDPTGRWTDAEPELVATNVRESAAPESADEPILTPEDVELIIGAIPFGVTHNLRTGELIAPREPERPDLDAIEARKRDARDTIFELLSTRYEKWRMTCPPDKRDSDMVIGAALDDSDAMVAYCRRLEQGLTAARAENEELKRLREHDEFWKHRVFCGAVPEVQDVRNELADYSEVIEQVTEVYCEITGGRFSKPNTLAAHVIQAASDFYERLYAPKGDDGQDETA